MIGGNSSRTPNCAAPQHLVRRPHRRLGRQVAPAVLRVAVGRPLEARPAGRFFLPFFGVSSPASGVGTEVCVGSSKNSTSALKTSPGRVRAKTAAAHTSTATTAPRTMTSRRRYQRGGSDDTPWRLARRQDAARGSARPTRTPARRRRARRRGRRLRRRRRRARPAAGPRAARARLRGRGRRASPWRAARRLVWAARCSCTTASAPPRSPPREATFDLAGARRERYERPGALPEVELGASLREDLERRDFTVNAIALHLADGELTWLPGARGGPARAAAARPARRLVPRRPDAAAAPGPLRRPARVRTGGAHRSVGRRGGRRRRGRHDHRLADGRRAAAAAAGAAAGGAAGARAPRARGGRCWAIQRRARTRRARDRAPPPDARADLVALAALARRRAPATRRELDELAFPADERDVVAPAAARGTWPTCVRRSRQPPTTPSSGGRCRARAAGDRGAGRRSRRRRRRRGAGSRTSATAGWPSPATTSSPPGSHGPAVGEALDAAMVAMLEGPRRHPRGAARRGPRMSAMATATLPQLQRARSAGRATTSRPTCPAREGAVHHAPRRRLRAGRSPRSTSAC